MTPVVVGVDGSLEAVEATQYAAEAADVRGLDLLVVHAFALPPGVRTCAGRLGSAATDAAQRVTEDTLSQVRVPTGLRVRTEVELTTPGSLLLRLSRTAALVTLGQHVFDVADQLVEGSVAWPLAAAADCPVIVVPRGWSRASQARAVAVALDGTSAAEAVLDFTFAEAERHQSPVVGLHVAHAGESADVDAAEVRNLEEILATAKESHPDLAVSVTLVSGDIAEAVLDASQDVRLMVLGRPHRSARRSWWRRSVAQAVLARARCPLVIVA